MAANAMPGILACSTHKYPERLPTIQIGNRAADAERRVVMLLGRDQHGYSSMPELLGGDEIEVSAELAVTTDHPFPSPDYCVSKPYKFNPHIRASLLLANGDSITEEDDENGIKIGETKHEICTHGEHHRRVVFEPVRYPVRAKGLPWQGRQSYLNLVLRAYHHDAEPGHVLLIGQNEPRNGQLAPHAKGDMGKINVIQYRGQPHPPVTVGRADALRNSHVPVRKEPRVIYSRRLVGLPKREQLLMEARFDASNPYAYWARVSAEVLISDKADGTDRHNPAREYVSFEGELGKGNGTNVSPGGTYTTQKYGTLRILDDLPMKVFANLVVTSAAPMPAVFHPGDPRPKSDHAVRIMPGGYLQITRVSPEYLG
jgi:hypothetical protein